VHERLYAAGGPERLQIGAYLRDLCNDVAAYSLPEESRTAIRVTAVETHLPAEQLIWLGLVVVEFVTNALKYGSPDLNAPIVVDVASNGGELQVSVSDQGRGLPADFDPQASKGLGMEVVGLLVKQLHGTLRIDRDWAGARFIVTMPVAGQM
jgi:two-component sensor histidine kinase